MRTALPVQEAAASPFPQWPAADNPASWWSAHFWGLGLSQSASECVCPLAVGIFTHHLVSSVRSPTRTTLKEREEKTPSASTPCSSDSNSSARGVCGNVAFSVSGWSELFCSQFKHGGWFYSLPWFSDIHTYKKNLTNLNSMCHLLGVLKYEVHFLRQELVCPRLTANSPCDKDDLELFILLPPLPKGVLGWQGASLCLVSTVQRTNPRLPAQWAVLNCILTPPNAEGTFCVSSSTLSYYIISLKDCSCFQDSGKLNVWV